MTEQTSNQETTQQSNESTDQLHVGAIVEATVTAVAANVVHAEFGSQKIGQITRKEWSDVRLSTLEGVVAVGERILAKIIDLGDAAHPLQLSRKDAVNAETWAVLRERFEHQVTFSVKILSAVKGGLVADVEGLRAFLPASLIDFHFQSDLSIYEGKTIAVILTELDEQQRRLIISRKHAIEKEQQSLRTQKLREFEVGQIVTGTVARLTPFGAFIDLGGVDGLLHVSEMSFARVKSPEDVVHPGDQVRVKVLRIDPDQGKISLSMKLEDTNPWRSVSEQFHVGQIVSGTVKRLASFGAFVEVAPGIEGLVHVSQLSSGRVESPAAVVTPGDQVRVKILELKPEEERMSLSIREAVKEQQKPAVTRQPTQTQTKAEPTSATLGELFGDVLREKFKL